MADDAFEAADQEGPGHTAGDHRSVRSRHTPAASRVSSRRPLDLREALVRVYRIRIEHDRFGTA